MSASCWNKAERLAIQDQQGEPRLALHYGWLPGDTVELAKLEHPRVTIRYPRRVVWQKDLCSDGKHRVTGVDACPRHYSTPAVEHSSCIADWVFCAARQMRIGSLAGPKSGMYKDFVSWSHIAGLCCVKPRSQCTNEACHFTYPSLPPLHRSGLYTSSVAMVCRMAQLKVSMAFCGSDA